MERTCAQCGQAFKAREAKQRFCGYECKYEWFRGRKWGKGKTKHQAKCETCGKSFESVEKVQRFCSRECWYGRNAGKPKFGTASCECCGQEFGCTTRGQRFCSRSCSQRTVSKRKREMGARRTLSTGYVSIKVADEGSRAARWRPEHRHVMEQHVGRPLLPQETVHHKNGDRSDNRLENLEMWSSAHTSGQRVEDLLAFAQEIIGLYGRGAAHAHCPTCTCFEEQT